MEVRNLLWVGRNFRARKRYRKVLTVLIKYGFEDVVARIAPPFAFLRRKTREGPVKERGARLTGRRLRLALEELGTTYIKFGQTLSTRRDLLPPDVIEELEKLQDAVPPFDFAEIRSSLETDHWGRPVSEIFEELDETPFAAASVAQIHRGRLRDGREVAVKVRRPGVVALVETDLVILETLAALIAKALPEATTYDPPGLVESFGRSMRRELDLEEEARNLDRFRALFRGDETYHVPEVVHDLTTPAVLVMDLIDGVKISDDAGLRARGIDPKVVATRGARAILKQVLRHGLFHADPHPGNLFVLEGNIICPIDYGLVGRLDDVTRGQLVELLRGVAESDVDRICQTLIEISGLDHQHITRELEVDVDDIVHRFSHSPLGRMRAGELMRDFAGLLYRHRLRLPPDILLLFRALATIEAVALRLDPEFDMVATIEPFVKELVRERLSPRHIASRLVKVSEDVTALALRLPRETGEIIDLVRRNRLRVGLEHRGLSEFVAELDRTGNRIVTGIVTSSLIMAAALVLNLDVGPKVWGYPALGVALLALSVLLGLRLAYAIYRSGKL